MNKWLSLKYNQLSSGDSPTKDRSSTELVSVDMERARGSAATTKELYLFKPCQRMVVMKLFSERRDTSPLRAVVRKQTLVIVEEKRDTWYAHISLIPLVLSTPKLNLSSS